MLNPQILEVTVQPQ